MNENKAMTAITVEEYEEYHRLQNMYHTEYFGALAEVNRLKQENEKLKEALATWNNEHY